MLNAISKLTKGRIGRFVYRPIQASVHLYRRFRHPDLPIDQMITRVSYNGRSFAITHRRWSTDDRNAIKQCFAELQYEMPSGGHGVLIERVYRQILASGKKPLIVDCGANIGVSVLWFSARYPEAHVIAVEPAPDNFDLLRKNTAGIDAELLQAGIGGTDGDAWLSNPTEGEMGYVTTGTEGIHIEIISLATLLLTKAGPDHVPFLLKVDIEGAEKSMFSAPSSLFAQFPLIVMEPHDWLYPCEGTSLEFFRFHAETGREFAMKQENVASIDCRSSILQSPVHTAI